MRKDVKEVSCVSFQQFKSQDHVSNCLLKILNLFLLFSTVSSGVSRTCLSGQDCNKPQGRSWIVGAINLAEGFIKWLIKYKVWIFCFLFRNNQAWEVESPPSQLCDWCTRCDSSRHAARCLSCCDIENPITKVGVSEHLSFPILWAALLVTALLQRLAHPVFINFWAFDEMKRKWREGWVTWQLFGACSNW